MSDKIAERIALLLNKAESTTPEEAEALTAAAEKLMIKHMIDQATIDARRGATGKKEQIVQIHVDLVGSYRKALVNLWYGVGSALGNMEFLKGNDNGKFIRFYLIGYESDVEQARTLLTSLQIQAVVALRDWWTTNKPAYAGQRSYDQWEARSSFINGFGNGASARIRGSRKEAVQQASTGTDLVLVERGQSVKEYMAKVPTRKARQSKYSYDSNANGAGYVAGQNAHTGEKGMTQGRGISA